MDVLLGNDYFEEILRTQNPFRPEGQLLRISWQEGTDTRKSNARRNGVRCDVEECATRLGRPELRAGGVARLRRYERRTSGTESGLGLIAGWGWGA